MLPLKECYTEDYAPIKCVFCGSEDIVERVMDWVDVGVGYLNGPVSELEFKCYDCGQWIGYWAYGFFMEPINILGDSYADKHS